MAGLGKRRGSQSASTSKKNTPSKGPKGKYDSLKTTRAGQGKKSPSTITESVDNLVGGKFTGGRKAAEGRGRAVNGRAGTIAERIKRREELRKEVSASGKSGVKSVNRTEGRRLAQERGRETPREEVDRSRSFNGRSGTVGKKLAQEREKLKAAPKGGIGSPDRSAGRRLAQERGRETTREQADRSRAFNGRSGTVGKKLAQEREKQKAAPKGGIGSPDRSAGRRLAEQRGPKRASGGYREAPKKSGLKPYAGKRTPGNIGQSGGNVGPGGSGPNRIPGNRGQGPKRNIGQSGGNVGPGGTGPSRIGDFGTVYFM